MRSRKKADHVFSFLSFLKSDSNAQPQRRRGETSPRYFSYKKKLRPEMIFFFFLQNELLRTEAVPFLFVTNNMQIKIKIWQLLSNKHFSLISKLRSYNSSYMIALQSRSTQL